MAESRLVPCNLMAWPRIRDLLPDQKLILYHLWATCPAACGCTLLDLGGFQGALNITAPAIADALAEFERRGLVESDAETGEVFIRDWFRFHKFASPSRRRLLEDSVKRILSTRLRTIVEKSSGYALREGKEREGSSSEEEEGGGRPPPVRPVAGRKKKSVSETGIECWTPDDVLLAQRLEGTHGLEAVKKAVKALVEAGNTPYPSIVSKAFGGAPNVPRLPMGWASSNEGIEGAGRLLKLSPRPQETYPEYAQRIRQELERLKREEREAA